MSESGSATLELVIAAPLLVLLVSLLLQLGVLYHSQNVVTAAAQAGVQEARTEDGTSGGGNKAAMDFMRTAAPDFIQKPSAKTKFSDNDTVVTVEVAGDAYAVLPWMTVHVSARATGSRERYVDDG